MIETVKAWSNINSGSFHTAGLKRMRAELTDAFGILGADISDAPLPDGTYVNTRGDAEPVPYEPSLLVRQRPEAPVQLVMTGHYDTVFPEDSAFQAWHQIDEDTLGGPGVADMKGGILVMLEALKALERSDDAKNVGYSVLLSPDEEIGSPGSAAVLARLGKTAHAGLTYEPTLPDGSLTGARKGSGNFEVVVRGKAAHAGREHHLGRNALAAVSEFVTRLDALNGFKPGVTFNVGKIEGGGPVNIVPDLGIARFNVRMEQTEDMDWIHSQISELIGFLNARDGISAHLHGGFTRPPKPFAPANQAVMGWVKSAGSAIGLDIAWQSSGGVCEGNNLWASGCPNVDTLGVVGGNIHSHEEYVTLSSFEQRAQLSALILRKIASGEFDARKVRGNGRGDGLMLVVRAARLDDFAALKNLADLAGPGFTSLSVGEADLEDKIKQSLESFGKDISEPEKEGYLLMLEDTSSGEVVGISAVKTGIGVAKPFFNFKIFSIAQASSAVDRRFDMDVMMMVNEFPGTSEVGTLFVHPDHRKGGSGRLIAQARYLLIAAAPDRFSPIIISELRGHVDEDGHSPFWEGVGRHFFHMEFNQADEECARSDNQFILDLMPKYPIYVDLLPKDAQEVIGRTHPAGKAARRMLEREGFRYDRVIDIFDGGPLVSAPRDGLKTVQDSNVVKVQPGKPDDNFKRALVSTDKIGDFRVCYAEVKITGDIAYMGQDVLDALGLGAGDAARIIIA